jgi:predicted phage tail protein
MNKLVKFKLHGNIWDEYKIPTDWEFKADTLSKCIKLLEMNTKKFYKSLYEFDKKNIKYEVIINGRKFKPDKELTSENIKDVYNSELMMKYDDLETVDIVPVFEGADSDVIQAILGVILIVVGVLISVGTLGGGTPLGVAIIGAGLTLLASGVVGLLTKPPKFEDFREIESGGKTSYLFSGPANIIGEGGPVPVGYGRLIVGSQVISAAYVVRDFNVADPSQIVRDEYGGLIRVLK